MWLFVFLFLIIYIFTKIDLIVLLITLRGILAPDRFWWTVSDLFLDDGSGVLTYRQLEQKHPNAKLIDFNFLGNHMKLVTDIGYIQAILDNSPFIFGAGLLKKDFFEPFMPLNVGISEGCPWHRRRQFNQAVLMTDQINLLARIFHQKIEQIIKHNFQPEQRFEWAKMAQEISLEIVYGQKHGPVEVFKMFSQANSIWNVLIGGLDIKKSHNFRVYQEFTYQILSSNNQACLLSLAKKVYPRSALNQAEFFDQIAHWIFPTVGLIQITLPRILLLLANHPNILKKLIKILKTYDLSQIEIITKIPYLRACLLETLRLNNPVVTTFRTLLVDYRFNDGQTYKKGTQFLILNNPVLRSAHFDRADQFVPERWLKNPRLEDQYYTLMFNQGPQRCPGKDLALTILAISLVSTLKITGVIDGQCLIDAEPIIDQRFIPQMINPFKIKINFTSKNSDKVHCK